MSKDQVTVRDSLSTTLAALSTDAFWALSIAADHLEQTGCYNAEAAVLLRKRLAKGGRIVKPKALMHSERIGEWLTVFIKATKAPGRSAQIALLTVMELPRETALAAAPILRWTLYALSVAEPRRVA